MSRLGLPARKSFIAELKRACAVPCPDNLNTQGLPYWTIPPYSNEVFTVVWVQGKVTEINNEGDLFCVDDGTGIIYVTKALSLPSGCPKPAQGQYLLVIGEMQMNGSRPSVRAMKYQNLTTEQEFASDLWLWEVADARQCLSLR